MFIEFLTTPVVPVITYAITIAVVLFIGIFIGRYLEDKYCKYRIDRIKKRYNNIMKLDTTDLEGDESDYET